jgi:hypothetical protein
MSSEETWRRVVPRRGGWGGIGQPPRLGIERMTILIDVAVSVGDFVEAPGVQERPDREVWVTAFQDLLLQVPVMPLAEVQYQMEEAKGRK